MEAYEPQPIELPAFPAPAPSGSSSARGGGCPDRAGRRGGSKGGCGQGGVAGSDLGAGEEFVVRASGVPLEPLV